MNLTLAAPLKQPEMQPLTSDDKKIGDLMVAGESLKDILARQLRLSGFQAAATAAEKPSGTCIAENAWLAESTLQTLSELVGQNAPFRLVDASGNVLAWNRSEENAQLVPADEDSFAIHYPWDLLRLNEVIIGEIAEDSINGDVHPSTVVEGHVIVGVGTRLLPGVFIEGNVVIGKNCKIGPNCYIRGNTAIGDKCHIGQAVEVKNSIIMNNSSLGHLTYCGDSVIGELFYIIINIFLVFCKSFIVIFISYL